MKLTSLIPSRNYRVAIVLLVLLFVAFGADALGQERQLWTNDRVQTERHPVFDDITDEGGTVTVTLADSSVYRQFAIAPNLDKVRWDAAVWYVCGDAVIWAESDTDAIARCPAQ